MQVPLGLPPPPAPSSNPITEAKAELGWKLFYERRLASERHSSCADCHRPDHGYAGKEPTQAFHRNVPTAFNRAYGRYEFWDGQAGQTLEELINGVLRFVNRSAKVPYWERIAAIPEYRTEFQAVFGKDPDAEDITQALATFQRTLLAGNSPFDRFQAGDSKAISAAAQRGRELFFGVAGCAQCHTGPNFSDERFHNIGIGQKDPHKRFYENGLGKPPFPELGRFNVTQRPEDTGAFKTPTLRELDETDPYMHDGSLATLADVVDYYDRGGEQTDGQDPRVHPLGLTEEQKGDLVAFLHSLSSKSKGLPTPELPK